WQVWNEPNTETFWRSGPDPVDYTDLLGAASAAIRREDPGAEVVTAGISSSRRGIPLADFVAGMYRAGAPSAFDTLAIHPYAAECREAVALAERTRRLMDREGDASPMRITELGWSTGGPPSRFRSGEHGQARRLRCALAKLGRRGRRLGLSGLAYYNWRDWPPPLGRKDFWGRHTGLLRADASPKPALHVFREAALELQTGTSHPTGALAPRAASTGSPDLREPIGALPLVGGV
ncbi:MAG: hypothetical protein M3133_05750, partial [Actinomycetota bacterium]|nr:hypothetical protein [Actinomycetota bacterium]